MGYLVQNVGWRYTQWLQFALFGATLILLVFTVPETRHNVILQKTAKEVEQELKKEGLHVQIEDENATDRKGLLHLVKSQLLRPYIFLFTEPIVTFLAIYQGFLFGIVYIFQVCLSASYNVISSTKLILEGCFPARLWRSSWLQCWRARSQLSWSGCWHTPGGSLQSLARPLLPEEIAGTKERRARGVFMNPLYFYATILTASQARMWAARWASFLFPISLFWYVSLSSIKLASFLTTPKVCMDILRLHPLDRPHHCLYRLRLRVFHHLARNTQLRS